MIICILEIIELVYLLQACDAFLFHIAHGFCFGRDAESYQSGDSIRPFLLAYWQIVLFNNVKGFEIGYLLFMYAHIFNIRTRTT